MSHQYSSRRHKKEVTPKTKPKPPKKDEPDLKVIPKKEEPKPSPKTPSKKKATTKDADKSTKKNETSSKGGDK